MRPLRLHDNVSKIEDEDEDEFEDEEDERGVLPRLKFSQTRSRPTDRRQKPLGIYERCWVG